MYRKQSERGVTILDMETDNKRGVQKKESNCMQYSEGEGQKEKNMEEEVHKMEEGGLRMKEN